MKRLLAATRGRPVLFASVALAAQVLLLLGGPVLRGRALFERDLQLFFYTQLENFVRIVTTPTWPLWDPYNAFGQPLLADPSAQVLYPATWLNLLMRPWVYYSLFALGHLWASGLGLWRLGLSLGLSRRGALVAALLWISSGPLMSLANNPPHFAGACWIPWVLLAAEHAARAPSARAAAIWALVLAGQILAGSADMCTLAVLACVVLLARQVDRHSWRRNWPLARTALVAILSALCLTAAMWLPAGEVALGSSRRALPEFMRTYWSMHPASILELFVPLSWRNLPLDMGLWAILYEGREPFLKSIYLGLTAMALALASLANPDGRLRRALLGLLLLGTLLALGRHTPFFAVLVTLVPPAQVFRYPVKALVLVGVALALLAGLGFDAWHLPTRERAGWRRRVVVPLALLSAAGSAVWIGITFAPGAATQLLAPALPPAGRQLELLAQASLALGLTLAAVLAALAAAANTGPRARGYGATWVALLALADLTLQHRDLNPSASPDLLRQRPAVLDLIPAGRQARLYVYDYQTIMRLTQQHLGRKHAYFPSTVPPGWSFREAESLAKREGLAPPMAASWGRETAFDLDYRSLYSRELNRLTMLLRSIEGTPGHRRLLQLAGVTHVVAMHTDGLEDLEPLATLPGFALDPVRVFRVPGSLPRVYAVGGARPADDDAGIETLLAPEFDPAREVVLADGAASTAPPDFASACQVLAARADHLRLDVQLSKAGYVVVLDSFAPGWRASVDGRAVRVERANIAFRAVPVPAGRHEVVLEYRPWTVFWGLAISALGALVLLWLGSRSPAVAR